MRSNLSRKGKGEGRPAFGIADIGFNFQTANDCKIVIASAAKQSILSFCCRMDCFASLAMTANADTASHSRGAMRPRFAINLRPER
jgi:hypothetical protein